MTAFKTAKFKIQGGKPLDGEVKISGAKNAALPILLSTILTSDTVVLKNVPDLADVKTSFKLLQDLGKICTYDARTGEAVISGAVTSYVASYELVKTMRASIMALGPLVAFCGQAEVSLPGGCAIGARPVDLHIKGLQAMGAQIKLDDGYIKATAIGSGRLQGGHIVMDKVSVTGTENLMMAACLGNGTTIIDNAALEPEIVDLAHCLNKMGAKIKGEGTPRLEIEGVEKLHGCEHSVVADRIEAGTYLIAGIATHGVVTCLNTLPSSLESVLQKLRQANALITVDGTSITADMRNRQIKPVDVVTAPHPGFPTDMQAQITVLNALSDGVSSVTETIFENRFMHIAELIRMGAHIEIRGNTVICEGVSQLKGAQVMSSDLRASASLVIAGLAAEGTTIVDRIYHMDRGYEHIETKVGSLGGIIERIY
ncbi:UDP-N-acetylglucosamine 1-carboxyvinyltransferase [Succinivibrio sp.]|uniref:UDP-N-acetylglucosamine 1-carboxyvinyltransferase n=1 Tax=Succinivibrio sp. TaxID=2053619 RepID=UPI003868E594